MAPEDAGRRSLILLRERAGGWAQVAPERRDELMRSYGEWTEDLRRRGVLLSAEAVQDGGRVLRSVGGEVAEEPYAEQEGVLTGIFVVRAEDVTEAAALARDCPALEHGAEVLVRRIVDGAP